MMLPLRLGVFVGLFVLATFAHAAPTAEQIAFFESRIRPVLVDACYECHSTAKKESGLAVDHRQGMLTGGDRGPLIVPGKPAESLLIKVIRHQEADLKMPRGGPKFKPNVVADFERWIREGAADPREKPPTAEEIAQETSWEQTRNRRKDWWSFRPLQFTAPAPVPDAAWNRDLVDRFVRRQQLALGLTPAAPADPATLLRRVTFILTGVPPTAEEIAAFTADPSPAAYTQVVDRLLASPRFGEHWGRQWLDWFRYAESHGSEGDPTIPHAWRYRDYIIRALNDDVSYYQLVREHIAGDLLAQPRVNAQLGIRESALGIGHLRMVQHGFAPTDAHDEEVRFIDNQIDVISKAFLGLTVSCARCHHHKFDPISQDDFYAWYGIFVSCRPGLITVDTPERLQMHRSSLTKLKTEIQQQLAPIWQASAQKLAAKQLTEGVRAEGKNAKGNHPLSVWAAVQDLEGEKLAEAWKQLRNQYENDQAAHQKMGTTPYPHRWQLTGDDITRWFRHGSGLANEQPAAAGEFHLNNEGEQVVSNVFPAGVYTHGLSTKHSGVLQSPRFRIDCDELYVRVAGGSNARVRYVVHNYPRVMLIYPHSQIETETAKWLRWDCQYWKGEDAHLEIVTGEDQPLDIGSKGGRSWFGAIEAIGRNFVQPPPMEPPHSLFAVLTPAELQVTPADQQAIVALYAQGLCRCIAAWKSGRMTSAEAEFLGYFVRKQQLPNALAQLPAETQAVVCEFRRLEEEIPVPTRAPGVHEGSPLDQPLYERGDHKKPLHAVPRRFLEVFDPQPYQPRGSGRLELAQSLANYQNPLVARVIVNRVWQGVFGAGLVRTPDNFGRLGEEPTHPELLDYLAAEFSREREASPNSVGSLKQLIRRLVLTTTFQQSSIPAEGSKEKDSENRLLTRFAPRRLTAEVIRDSLIAVAGGLDETHFGPSVAANSKRRSIYVQVKRNSLDPFLSVFDAPEPSSALGKREATNVPAQSLALLNDPQVVNLARTWGEKIAKDASVASDDARVRKLFITAVGREPSASELQKSLAYLNGANQQQLLAQQELERLRGEIQTLRQQIDDRLEPVSRKLREKTAAVKPNATAIPKPISHWEFDSDLRDSVGPLHGEFKVGNAAGVAKFRDGGVVLDGQSAVITPVIEKNLAAKTLAVLVQLDTLEQKGGGVISVESPEGKVFDAIVFGEREARHWMAGSDHFRRTKSVGGTAENEATKQPVHIVIVYDAAGQVTLYRDGALYGKPYQAGELLRFSAGQARVLFGLRHSPSSQGRHLTGLLLQAQLYDRALTADEILAVAKQGKPIVTRADVLAALSPQDREAVERAELRLADLEKALAKNTIATEATAGPSRKWQDLCQSLFNLKEFIYLR